MNKGLIEACKAFDVTTDGVSCGNGHINSTFMAYRGSQEYILQLINTNVFKKPVDMMNNINKVTDHIRDKVQKQGGDVEAGDS